MSNATKILIADDHPIFRRGLRDVVREDDSMQLLGEAGDGAEALRLIAELKPHVAVIDHDMPKLNGLQVALAVRRQKLPVALVMLTMFKEERLFNEAMGAGFLGYVLKENAASDLIQCIHAVAAGRAFISSVRFALPYRPIAATKSCLFGYWNYCGSPNLRCLFHESHNRLSRRHRNLPEPESCSIV